jgi:PPK2 family polyphosphate:nucleotide phosphotransferase
VADVADERELIRRARRTRRLLRVKPGRARLDEIDPGSTPGLPPKKITGADRKAWAQTEAANLRPLLGGLQERLFASAKAGDRRRVLLVLQAIDCGGKDGTIKSVVGALNPQGVHIKAFGAPTEDELARDYLWRIHLATPRAGYVGVFNRSHYEDVLAVRVHALVPAKVWRARYEQINAFEEELIADGVTLIKVMLHISPAEQRERLLARLADPTKHWKFNPSDLADRAHWADYQAAYADALTYCGTSRAPWYVVPADRKWYRNWAVGNLLLAHLDEMRLSYPDVRLDVPALKRRLETGEKVITSASGEQKVNIR